MRLFAIPIITALAACACFAQNAPPAFEVASIKPAAPQDAGRFMVRLGGDPGRVDYANVGLRDVLARAYNVKRYQIQGPAWLDSERYDITAKVPDGVKPEQVPAMLQALLADRFKMTVHKETKEQPIYALVVGKNGPKLTPAEPVVEGAAPKMMTTPDGGKIQAPPRGAMMMTVSRDGGSSSGGTAKMRANGATLGRFADMLSNMLDRPVVDQTGIEGNYDIELDVSMEELAGMRRSVVIMGPGAPAHGGGGDPAASDSSVSIFTAVQTLGLKLDPKKGPVEYVIVDKADKVPTEN